jgi:hypothetical protein
MPLIIRIDVDRPYGKHGRTRHILSRLSSDAYFPTVESFGYLRELGEILRLLNERQARAHVFFRQCTLPSPCIQALLDKGGHHVGLHLENSRSFDAFDAEKRFLEERIGRPVRAFSKHGSGGARYGRRHHAPYEPEKYVQWGQKARMKVFFGNLEDPRLPPTRGDNGFVAFPSAFWLEPHWRDTRVFPCSWLQEEARKRDVVVLIHPENVLESGELTEQLSFLTRELETRLVE